MSFKTLSPFILKEPQSYILDIVNRLNKEFQSKGAKIHVLYERISELYITVLRNFMKKDYLDSVLLSKDNWYNPTNFLPVESIYYGARTEMFIAETQIDSDCLKQFRVSCLNFYVALSENILKFTRYFAPNVALFRHSDFNYTGIEEFPKFYGWSGKSQY